MLVEGYDLEILTPPCDPLAEDFVVKAHLHADISQVLPYLNAVLDHASYNQPAQALSWRHEGRSITFHNLEIAVASLDDRQQAIRVVDELLRLVNKTWDQREGIKPSYAACPRPPLLKIYRHMPGDDCQRCGLPTCTAFARQLAAGQVGLEACPVLNTPDQAPALARLRELMGQ